MKTRVLICLLLTLATAGCGWQLRGSKNIAANIDALTVTGENRYGKMARSLAEEMRVQHIADTGTQAWNLLLLEEEMKENVLAYSDTNNAAMFEIELIVRFSVTNSQGATVIAPNTERVVRVYEVNNNRRLAMDREMQLLKDEAYREMANNILRRIDFIAAQKQNP